MMVRDIPVSDVKKGKNWLCLWKRRTPSLDQVVVEFDGVDKLNKLTGEATSLGAELHIVYSGLLKYTNHCIPLLMIKELTALEYGGEYCIFKNGAWAQLGVPPQPDAEHSTEYIANPVEEDPSFSFEEMREENREGFRQNSGLMTLS